MTPPPKKSARAAKPQLFRPIASGRNFEIVIAQMKEAIEGGRLKPQDKLPPEPELATQFAVSRSVVREALKVLELSGYLEVRRGYRGGTFVSAPKPEEFTAVPPPPIPEVSVTQEQLADVRFAIEPYAARLAASREAGDGSDIHEATEAFTLRDERPARVLAAAVDFHVAVARVAGNPLFVAVLEHLRPAMYWGMRHVVQSEGWRETIRVEHERIAREIEAGQAEEAEHAMHDHLRTELGGPHDLGAQ